MNPQNSHQLKVAINGFGRIGRNVLRAWFESAIFNNVQWQAINDAADIHTLAHLFKYDSTHGRFNGTVDVLGNTLKISNHHKSVILQFSQQNNPSLLNWQAQNIDVVLECTGLFRSYDLAYQHITAGAKRVIIGAAPFDRVDAAVVFGVNEQDIKPTDQIISSVSCTTQALVPLVKMLDESVGIEHAFMTEIHAVTTDQVVLDHAHRDLRRARASGVNIIPTTTSALGALKQIMPHMQGKIEGVSVRVPTQNVAAISLSFTSKKPTSIKFLNNLFSQQAQQLSHIMAVSNESLVSSDFYHQSQSLCMDLQQTQVVGNLVNVWAWYDNEWGYAHRLLDICASLPPFLPSTSLTAG